MNASSTQCGFVQFLKLIIIFVAGEVERQDIIIVNAKAFNLSELFLFRTNEEVEAT